MKKRILAGILTLVMLICLLPVTAIADGNEGWTVDNTAGTVKIYTAEGLRAWADSITDEHKDYNGFTVSIENDIDLSGPKWTSIIGLGGTITIDGNNHTISNMRIEEQENVYDVENERWYTFLGFIGDIAYGTRLTIQDITFENAHVQDPGGDSQYSWCGVVVGHGPMDEIGKAENSECTFRNVTVKNSVVTGGHNSAAILGFACSTPNGHLFENCHVLNTFVGGYGSTSAVLFSMGHANVTVKDCSASKVRLYSDGLTFDTEQTVEEQWLGYLYEGVADYEGENTAEDSRIVYPVVFHYTNTDIKEYVQVDTPLKGTWYAEEACKTPVTQIIGTSMYPKWDTISFKNDEAYETQDTEKVAKPLTHGVIHLYTKEEYVPEQPTTDYLIPGLWLNTNDHYSYLIGYSDGTVRPNGKITRAEVATIFFRLLDDDTRAKYWSSKNDFSDVSADKWYNNAVSTLSNMGVIGGYADGTFRPDAPISRAEFAKIAVSFTQNNGSATYNYFTDVKTTDWFAPYVTAAKDAGLIEGYSDGSFKPESKITRAEACAIVNRTLGRKPSKAHMKISDRIDWPDVQTTDWFYEAIMEATNSHTYQMGKRVETWNDKLPQRDWAALETGWANAYTGNGGEVR